MCVYRNEVCFFLLEYLQFMASYMAGTSDAGNTTPPSDLLRARLLRITVPRPTAVCSHTLLKRVSCGRNIGNTLTALCKQHHLYR